MRPSILALSMACVACAVSSTIPAARVESPQQQSPAAIDARLPNELDVPARAIAAGAQPSQAHPDGTLIVVAISTPTLREIDVATLTVTRSLELDADGEITSLRRDRGRLVVLVNRGEMHDLFAVDADAFAIVARATHAGAAPDARTDHAFPTVLAIEKTDIRVIARGECPEGVHDEMGCVRYETYDRDRLVLRSSRTHAYGAVWGGKVRLEPEIEDVGTAENTSWSVDENRRSITNGATTRSCTTRGARVEGGAQVGRRAFFLLTSCCNDVRGGLFVCDTE